MHAAGASYGEIITALLRQGRNAEAREHFRRSLASPDPFGFRAEVERALALPGIAGSGADAAGANAEELRRQE